MPNHPNTQDPGESGSTPSPPETTADPTAATPDTTADDPIEDPPVPFAPGEPTDGRAEGDFKSRYGRPEWIQIGIESLYLLIAFVVSALVLLWAGPSVATPISADILDETEWRHARPFTLAFFGGALGGTLFALKWLYHSVAKGIWNHDRILWRLFAPLLSAGAATTFVILSTSGVLPFFGRELAGSPAGATGIGLLVGFFSDRAFSMFENTIQSLFGSPKSHERTIDASESGRST